MERPHRGVFHAVGGEFRWRVGFTSLGVFGLDNLVPFERETDMCAFFESVSNPRSERH
jgi:hypothetical protein